MQQTDNNDSQAIFEDFYEKSLNALSFIEVDHSSKDRYSDIFKKSYKILENFINIDKESNLKLFVKPVGSALLGNNPNQTMIENVPFGFVGEFSDDEAQNYIVSSLTYITLSNYFKISVSNILKEYLINNESNIGEIKVVDKIIKISFFNKTTKKWQEIPLSGKTDSDKKEKFNSLFEYLFVKIKQQKDIFQIKDNVVSFEDKIFENLLEILEKKDIDFDVEISDKHFIQFNNYLNLNSKSGICASYYLYNTPFIKENNGKYENYGNIVISTNTVIEDDNTLRLLLQNYSLNVLSIFRLIYQLELERDLMFSQTKSAISAIMSRNMSHNLGSHVLSSLAYNTNMPYDDVILYKYLQHRMDFIAQITTDWPQWTYPVWFVRDLMRKFYTQTHLLNYIVESEDLSAYEFQNKDPEGDPIPNQKNKLIIEIEKDGLKDKVIKAFGDSQDNRLNHDTDTQISIPGGTVGYHSFYVVLENIIRNTAKHEWSKNNEDNERPDNLIMTVRFYDESDKDHTRFEIFSNIKNTRARSLADDINKKLKNGFIDESTGELIHRDWGLAEMKIALGYLNKIDPIEIGRDNIDILLKDDEDENKQLRHGLLKAKVVKDEYEDDYFGYEFIIPKPKEILIIDKEADKDLSDKLKKYNIHLTKDFNTKNLDYELVVVKNKELIEKLIGDGEEQQVLLSKFPNRVLLVDKEDIPDHLKNRLYSIPNSEINFQQFNEKGNSETTDINKKTEDFKFNLFSYWMLEYTGKSGEDDKIYLHGSTVGGKHEDNSTGKITVTDKVNNNPLCLSETKFKSMIGINDFDARLKLIIGIKDSSIRDQLKDAYYKSSKKMTLREISRIVFNKYDEDIITLPRAYRASQIGSEQSGNSNKEDVFKKHVQLKNKEIIHFDDLNDVSEEQKKYLIHLKRHFNFEKDFYYSEALSGAQSYFNLLINGNENSADYLNQKVIVQLLENAFSGILIIDERVHEYYLQVTDDVKKQLQSANIYTLDDKAINSITAIKEVLDSKSYLNEIASENQVEKSIKFLIIHQGIIDKLDKKNKKDITTELVELQNNVPNIVITSGRGLPKENLPKGFNFIPYSTIAETIMKPYHEKFLLTNILLKLTNYES